MRRRLARRLAEGLLLDREPSYLIAFVTGRCQLGCATCCPASRDSRDTAELTPAAWARGLEGARSLLHLTITGGEPFEREDLVPLVLAMVETTGVPRLSINSSGQASRRVRLEAEELLQQLPHRALTLSVSMDGPADIHDHLRGRGGAWEAARDTIYSLADLRDRYPWLTLRITSVLQPGNRESLEAFLELTDTWPVDFHELALLRDVPAPVQRLLARDYERLTQRQLAQASGRFLRGLDWRLARRLRADLLSFLAGGDGAGPCTAGGRMVEILPDGTVVGCELSQRSHDAVLGSIAGGERLTDVLRAAPARRFRREAHSCRCSFECAAACNTIFRPQRWWGL